MSKIKHFTSLYLATCRPASMMRRIDCNESIKTFRPSIFVSVYRLLNLVPFFFSLDSPPKETTGATKQHADTEINLEIEFRQLNGHVYRHC